MYSNMWLQWLHLFICRYEPGLWCNPLWVTLGCLGYTLEKGLRVKSKKEIARYSGGWVSALSLQPATRSKVKRARSTTRWKVKIVESTVRIERAERLREGNIYREHVGDIPFSRGRKKPRIAEATQGRSGNL